MYKTNDTTAVILASGLSQRMGMNKTELKFNNSKNFIQKICDEYVQFGCKAIIAVLNKQNYASLKLKKITFNKKIIFIINEYPEKGRFYTFKKGISQISKGKSVFIQNIDNPFVNQNILNILYLNSGKADYIIPSYKKKGGHPILLSEQIIKDIKNLKNTDYNLKDFLNRYNKTYIETDDNKITVNINTRSDYHLYF